MVELIFVIVILGVLAAVALPKLVATRDDAELVKFSKSLSVLITDLASYRVAQGVYSEDVSSMTNVKLINNSPFYAELPARGNLSCVYVKVYNEEDTSSGINAGVFEVSLINKNDKFCQKTHELATVKTMTNSGTKLYLIDKIK